MKRRWYDKSSSNLSTVIKRDNPKRGYLSLFGHSIKKTTAVFVIAGVLLVTGITAPIEQAGALTKTSELNPTDRARSFAYYKALRRCMEVGAFKQTFGSVATGPTYVKNRHMTAQEGQSFEWFHSWAGATVNPVFPLVPIPTQNEADTGIINDSSDDGIENCGDGSNKEGSVWIKKAAKLWGYENEPGKLLCDLGFTRDVKGSNCSEIIAGSTNDFHAPGDAAKSLDTFWTNKLGNKSTGITSIGAGEYKLLYQSFMLACKVTKTSAGGTATYTLMEFKGDSATPTAVKYSQGDRNANGGTIVRIHHGYTKNCDEIAKMLDAKDDRAVQAYAIWAKEHPDDLAGDATSNTCEKNPSADGCTETTSCGVEGIGWLLCPAATAMAAITDGLFSGVKDFMKVSPVKLSPVDNPLFSAWSVMRSFANVSFVIVFLVIIFSQLTSAGVSNYGVKKLLPRLIIGAILVNLSFYICAIAVDISNILGVGIQEALKQVGALAADTNVATDSWESLVAAGLGGTVATVAGGAAVAGTLAVAGAVTSGGVWAVLAGLLPLLVGALFALVIAFLVLLARQALIIILIVVSPLAFVAFLLPNTEALFKKWRTLFMSLLVLFPLLSLVFGGSFLASVILRETAASASGAVLQASLYIGSFAVQAIPFFITPLLINLSQGVLSRFAGLINNPNKGPFDRLRKAGERVAKDTQNRGYAKRLSKPGLMNYGARRRARIERVSGSLDNVAKHAADGFITDSLASENSNLAMRMSGGDAKMANTISTAAIAKNVAEDLESAGIRIDSLKLDRVKMRAIADGSDSEHGGDSSMRAAAIQRLVASNDVKGINDLWDQSKTWEGREGDNMRATFAKSLEASSGRPGYISQGAIAALKIGGNSSTESTILDAVKAGTYSPAKIASADKDELQVVNETVAIKSSTDVTFEPIHQKLINDAHTALTNEDLAKTLGKNLEQVESIRNNQRNSRPLE